MSEKIILVTAGGDIASFHAGMRRMHQVLESEATGRFELVGANGGLQGLIKGDFIPILKCHLEDNKAGSLIGADREIADTSKIKRVMNNNNIYAVIMMGGDNHLREASRLFYSGVNIVGYPKTMDWDLSSFLTCGAPAAVSVGARRTKNHYNTAITGRRVFYVGLFGRDADHLLCGVAAYGTNDIAIPCEREYHIKEIIKKVKDNVRRNKKRFGVEFAVVPFSEGARIRGVNAPPKEHYREDKHGQPKLIPEWIGMELVRLSEEAGIKSCFQCHTYDLRDSNPTAADKKLSRMASEECIRMILEGDFGKCSVFAPNGNGSYRVERDDLGRVTAKRYLRPTGYFDYEKLRPTQLFFDVHRGLFGERPGEDEFVYKNMKKLN